MCEIKKMRTHPTTLQSPPAYDPQGNGAIENAVDQQMGQLRALKIGLEGRVGRSISTKAPIIEWLVEHASMLICRGQVGKDGKTPYRRIMGKECLQKAVEIGEQVLAKPKRGKRNTRRRALATRWQYGTWVWDDLQVERTHCRT